MREKLEELEELAKLEFIIVNREMSCGRIKDITLMRLPRK